MSIFAGLTLDQIKAIVALEIDCAEGNISNKARLDGIEEIHRQAEAVKETAWANIKGGQTEPLGT